MIEKLWDFTICKVRKWVSPMAQMIKNISAIQETLVQSLSGEDPLEAIVDGVTTSRTQMSDQHTPGKEGSSFIWLPLLLLVYCLALQLWNLTVAPCLPFCLANEWMNK